MADTLPDLFEACARRHRNAAAFLQAGTVTTYGQAATLVRAAVRTLAGVGPGDAVAVSMNPSPLHCIAFLALARMGACIVPLAPSLVPAQRAALVGKFGAILVLSDQAAHRVDGVGFLLFDRLTAQPDEPEPALLRPPPDAPLRLSLTSGTTGEPKAVVMTHLDWLARMEQTAATCDATTRLLPPSLHITVGCLFVIGVLTRGGVLAFPRSYAMPDLASAVHQHGVTHLLLSPSAAQQLVDVLPDGGPAFPSLRHLRLLGAQPSPALLDRLRERVSEALYVPYGLTELGTLTLATPGLLREAPGSAGHVEPWAHVEIVDGEGREVLDGTIGELRARTTPMPSGYFGEEAPGHGRFRDGWFHPGDLARFDEHSRLHIEGRTDDVINLGGPKILPGHVEAVLEGHAQVREAIVFRLDADDGPGVLAAAVVPASRTVTAELLTYCRENLGAMSPERIFVMEEFPRNASGKVLRADVAKRAIAKTGDGAG